jgi:hypothetical protein
VFPATRSRLGTFTALAFDATLTVLSEPIHRRSLSNARAAMEERQYQDRAAAAGLQQFNDVAARAPEAHRIRA